jgi:transposase
MKITTALKDSKKQLIIEIMSRIIIDGKIYRYSNKEIANILGIHYNTITNVLNRGYPIPQYKRIITTIVNKHKEAVVL